MVQNGGCLKGVLRKLTCIRLIVISPLHSCLHLDGNITKIPRLL